MLSGRLFFSRLSLALEFRPTVYKSEGEDNITTFDAHQLEKMEVADNPLMVNTAKESISEKETSQDGPPGVTFMPYESELQLPHIMRLMKADLSEPYSIYTYRYFIHNWPNLCFLVRILNITHSQ